MKSKLVKRIFTLFILCVLVFSSFNFSACNTNEDKEPIASSDYLSESDRNKEIIDTPFNTHYVFGNKWGFAEYKEIKDLKAHLRTYHPNYTFLLIDTEDIDQSLDLSSSFRTFYQVHLNEEGIPHIITNATIDIKDQKDQPEGFVEGMFYDWTYRMLSYPLEYASEEISYKHYIVGGSNKYRWNRACYLMQDETISAIFLYNYSVGLEKIPEDSYMEEMLNKYTFYFQT